MHLQLWRRLLLIAAGAAVLFAVARAYAPAETATFIWDDHVLAERDARFRHVSIREVMTGPFWPDTPLADARAPYYRPLVLLTLRFDLLLGGTAEHFHRTNVALHLLGCALVALCARRLGARPTGAVLGALSWGLAPRLSESVVWISGRTDLLAGVLGLAALATAPDVTSAREPRRPGVDVGLAALSGAFLFGALASKEVAIAFAAALVVAILRARKRERGSRRWMVRLVVNVVAPAGVYAILRRIALAGDAPSPRALGAGRRMATALEALGRYAEMLADPLRPKTMIGMLGEIDMARAFVGGGVLVAAAAACVLLRKRAGSGVRIALTITFVSLGLVLHLVPFTLAGAVTADRLLYVPLAGLVLAAVLALEAAPVRLRRASALAALAFACFSGAATRARAADYQDEARFWLVAAENAHPHNTTPLSSLAGVLRESSELELACGLYAKANAILSASERAGLTAHRRTRENLGSCWALVGRYADARRVAEELAREYPAHGRVQMGLGFARIHTLDFDGAEEAFAASTELEPALARIVRPAVEDLALARANARLFATPVGQAERPAFARHLARIGHLPEAEAVHLAIAEDATAKADERLESLGFLVTHGSLPAARRALGAVELAPRVDLMEARRSLAVRERANARITPLRTRIEAVVRS